MTAYLVYAGFVAAVLLVVKYMINKAKADAVMASLSHKNREEDAKEVAALEQEIKDAKINYDRLRNRAHSSTGNGDGAEVPSNPTKE